MKYHQQFILQDHGFLSRKYDASIYNSSAELQDDGFEENATVTSEIQTEVQKRNRVFR
ncbi:5716_t:CDS:2 [Funneliformis mosseae]|uniref:5716_t:CDS:1 n=1 Tax=Funneliformis mosseae TaxID=27381 RepID=A0A9N9F3J4_FUNMO|nr:5716_t:CDS:2 [Funneliformis mosseae]